MRRTSYATRGASIHLIVLTLLGCTADEQPLLSVATDASQAAPAQPSEAVPVLVPVVDAGAPLQAGDAAWCRARPIVAARCAVCHDGAGSGGSPFALRTPTDFLRESPTFPGTTIRERAGLRIHDSLRPMPPQPRLSSDELALLDGWLDSPGDASDGARCEDEGADAGAPTIAPWPTDCEQTYRFVAHDPEDPAAPFRFERDREERVTFNYDAPWGDQPVQARAMRPIFGNRKILHHWILYESRVPGSFLTGWAPGRDNLHGDLPSDVGMFLPGGPDSLRLEFHYFNKGPGSVPELDASGIEICIATKPNFRPKMATVYGGFTILGDPFVLAPARSVNHSVTGRCTINAREPVHMLTTSPHGHKLATHMKFTVQKRGQPEIVMLDAPFSFDEQTSYTLPEEIIVETGDVMTTTCTYTNPTDVDVGYGGDTSNEMCFNYVVYYPADSFTCDLDLLGILADAL